MSFGRLSTMTAIGLTALGAAAAQSDERLPAISPAQYTVEQKQAAVEFEAARKTAVFGPFEPMMHSPQLMSDARAMGDYLRFKSPTPRKYKEIAIMLTSRYWGGQYVWYSHRQQALDAGLGPAFIAAMAAGERPANMSPDEATMYDFCTQLLSTRQVSDTNFKAAKALIGERGIVEIVGLMGQYTGLTMLFVVDRYPVPAGVPDEVNRPM